MSDAPASAPQPINELRVSAHLMALDAGVYCVYPGAGSEPPDPLTGFPAVRLTVPPAPLGREVTITGLREDGWMGAMDAASLIRVGQGPAHILVTVYQLPDSQRDAPKLQVTRVIEGAANAAAASRPVAAAAAPVGEDEIAPPVSVTEGEVEMVAHVQRRGDMVAKLGEWIGVPDSQTWIEGFALAPKGALSSEDVEYQAVLGRGWLSPWAEGGQFCGSRGMALPILGLRVRLRGAASDTHEVELHATFTDGTKLGPIAAGEPCEAASLAPLEAFRLELKLMGAAEKPAAKPKAAKPANAKPSAKPAAPPPPPAPAPRRKGR